MTEAAAPDRSLFLQSKRAEWGSIATSRKRKLRELYAIATVPDGIPNLDLVIADVPPVTPAETQFLIDADLSLGRRLAESAIPTRPTDSPDDLAYSSKRPRGATGDDAASAGDEIEISADGPLRSTEPQRSLRSSSLDATRQNNALASKLEPQQTVPDVPLLITPGEGSDDAKRISRRQATPSRDEKPAGAHSRTDLWRRREESRRTSKSRSPSAQPVIAVAEGGPREIPADSRPTLQIPNGRPRTPKARFEEDSQDDEVDLIKEGGSAVRSLLADSHRQADLLSSPGSTAQSATTPAGHEASTDTSPDTRQGHDEDISESKDSADGTVGRRSLGPDAEGISGPADESTLRPGEDTTESTTVPEGDSWQTRADANVKSLLNVAIPEKEVASLRLEGSSMPPSSRTEDIDAGVAVTEEVSHGLPSATRLGDDVDEEMIDRPVTDDTITADPVPDDSDTQIAAMDAQRGSLDESRPLTAESHIPTSGEQPPDLSRAALQALNHRARDGKRTTKVVFGSRKAASDQTAMAPTAPYDLGNLPNDDYFVPLFVQGFAQSSKWMKVIEALLSHAHKTVSTQDQYLALLDNQACRLLRRVYQLQQHEKWSFRQPARCPEPARPTSHWDLVLQEAKWMRTDFREERKWRRAAARSIAYACAEWVESSPEQRKVLQVNAVLPPKEDASQQTAENDAEAAGQPQIEESVSNELIADPEEAAEELPLTVAPSAIFALQNDDVVFGLNHTPSSDKLLAELPIYGAPLVVPRLDQNGTQPDPDAAWKRPALPLNKYIDGHLTLKPSTPPTKRSRYQYMLEDEEDIEEFSADGAPLASEPSDVVNTTVALFSPEMKGLRDRLYTGHQFRPPTESPMPLQSFYEWRMPSQWTWAEDDELKQLVRDYQYNWSLISSILTFKTIFATGGERRTPWECFERWVNLEGLPSEMSKQPYFKMWHNRIDAGQRMVQQQYQNLQQQPNAAAVAASLSAVARRRQSVPLRVDKRRASKHFAIMDAMRKVAKRRETALQKQQQTASHAASRKANETQQQHGPTKTPRDYSLMRFERDQQLAEKMAQFAQRQQEAQRRAMQQRAQAQAGGSAQAAAENQRRLNQPANLMNQPVNRPNVAGQLAVPGAARQPIVPPGMQAPVAGMANVPAQMAGLVPPMPMNALPQAQMQALQAQHRLNMGAPQANMNLLIQARQISDQQRQAILQQQQQQHQAQLSSPPQGQMSAQQANAGLTPGVPAAQLAQMAQMMHGTPNQINGVSQASPNGVRPTVNGINQQNFMTNAQAQALLNAQYGSINGAGMAGSPVAGLGMGSVSSSSPRSNSVHLDKQYPAYAAQLAELENQYRLKQPGLTADQARHMAHEQFARLIVQKRQQQLSQSAMNAAAGGATPQGLVNGLPNGMAASTSPHQYAQMLRAQQQVQAAQANGQQQQQQQQNGPQHQRSSSGGAASVAGK